MAIGILVVLFAGSAVAETPELTDVSQILDQPHSPDFSGWSPLENNRPLWVLYERSDQLSAAQLAARFFVREFGLPMEQAICVGVRVNDEVEDPSNELLDSLSVTGCTVVPRSAFHSGPVVKFSRRADTSMVFNIPWQGPVGEITVRIELPGMFVWVPVVRTSEGWAVDEGNMSRAHVNSIGH